MKDYKSGSHAVWDCKYPVLRITKYRCPVLQGDVGKRARELLREISRSLQMTIYAGGDQPGSHAHAHRIPPHLSVWKAVQYLKGNSSHRMLAEFAALRKRYWDPWGRGHWWQRAATSPLKCGRNN